MLPDAQARDQQVSSSSGFSLTELMASVSIVGILSSIALPNYIQQLNRAKQSDVVNLIAQIQNTIQAYREEFLSQPSGWDDLALITAVPTAAGAASGGAFSAITSPGGQYQLAISANGDVITLSATPISIDQRWQVLACLNTENGYSAISRDPGSSPNCSGS